MLAEMFMESNRQDQPIQIEDGNSIIEESRSQENSSSSNNPEREDDYAAFLQAVQRGDWNATRKFLEVHPTALTARILNMGGTILHAAVDVEQEHIVAELVNMISEQHPLLTMQDYSGYTALHVAIMNGNQRLADCLIKKNNSLVSIRSFLNFLPVLSAMVCGHKDLAHYLYSQTPFHDLVADEGMYAKLLNSCIYARDLDMALDLLERCPHLAFTHASDQYVRGMSPLEVLAIVSTESFEGGKGMVFWKQWIYNHCIHVSLAPAGDQLRLNIENGKERTIRAVRDDPWHQLVSSLWNLLGFKHLYEMKVLRVQFQQLLSRMCQAMPTLLNTIPSQNPYYFIAAVAIFSAINRGNFEFVYHIVKANPDRLWLSDPLQRTIFHWAILQRQHRIFNLIYSLKKKNALLNSVDSFGNTMLHMAGELTENTVIVHIRGAALQMQREVQWFKEVERICPHFLKEIRNKEGLTPRQLFMRDHRNLRKEGEEWMKGMATSCTVVGALIITIMFAAAFTIPGGNNQDTGLPILMHNKLFKLFILTDSVSLFSSSTSVLIFLGILTSRYAEEDFFISLPRKMIIGLFALFFSITTMMVTFSASLLLMLRGEYRLVVPIIGLASVPIILFVLMQFRLLIDMLVSTYGSGIFDRKMKPWL